MKKLILIALAAIFTLSGSMAMAQRPQNTQHKQPTVEQRIEQLKKQLDLSTEQCDQILTFEKKRVQPKRGDREAMKKMMAQEQANMKKILTKEQYAKWEKMMKKGRRPAQGQGGQRPTGQPRQ